MRETMASWLPAGRSIGARRSGMIAALALLLTPITGLNAGAAADLELGRHLSAECVSCHGAARAGGAIPDIFGHEPMTFVEVMKAYRDKRLPNEAMQTVASRLNDEDLAALALYFATAKKTN
ncbi:MAG: c-type cytochrome [Pseudolabrys sp.]|nr:c-type cytochrome [Pseudolabrys sp.]